jgi:hypothetical protein
LNEHVNRGFAQFAGDIYPPPMPIHARHKLRLCVLKFHLILINSQKLSKLSVALVGAEADISDEMTAQL